jgi:glycosyltransferase involved in cell wall biosynthesis
MDKKKLLWISDSPRFMHVGQSHVTREILNRLTDKFDITVGGYGDIAVTPPIAEVKFPIRNILRSKEVFDPVKRQAFIENGEMIPNLIKEIKPDYVVFSHDIWLFPNIHQMKKESPNTKFIGYITLDGDPPYIGWKPLFYSYDLLITPSHYSTNAIKDKWFDLDVTTVPYGVNQSLYRPPKQGKKLLKEAIFHATNNNPRIQTPVDMRDKFTGIFVGANSNRKNLTAIYWAWKEFEKGKNDVYFLMIAHHASPTIPTGSYPLETFTDTDTMQIITFPIEENSFAPMIAASDILLHPVLGEGFGLPVMEAMSCGTVPIAPNFSALTDFCNKDNSFILDWVPLGRGWGIAGSVPVQEDVLKKLEKAYEMWKKGTLYKKKGLKAIETAKKYTWEESANGIVKAIDYLEEKRKKLAGKLEVIRVI